VPSGTLTTTLNALVEIGTAAVITIEASLGITRPPESPPKASAAPPLAPHSPPSPELKNPAAAATN
jgi:hypothetical protein